MYRSKTNPSHSFHRKTILQVNFVFVKQVKRMREGNLNIKVMLLPSKVRIHIELDLSDPLNFC